MNRKEAVWFTLCLIGLVVVSACTGYTVCRLVMLNQAGY